MKSGKQAKSTDETLAATIAATMERAVDHPYHMIEDGLIYTLDSNDLRQPVKPFPKLPYIKYFFNEWLNEDLIALHKNRRMLISWGFIVAHLWLAMFHPGAQIFFVSDKEQKSNELVRRAEFIYDHIPPDKMLLPRKRSASCLLGFPGLDSFIMGLPSGSDQLRQYTASAIFFDEFAFWEAGQKEALASARPTVQGGGKLTIVSSVHEGPFYDICFDKLM
jgi:hypothetical protein